MSFRRMVFAVKSTFHRSAWPMVSFASYTIDIKLRHPKSVKGPHNRIRKIAVCNRVDTYFFPISEIIQNSKFR